jgi:hypothetical protein
VAPKDPDAEKSRTENTRLYSQPSLMQSVRACQSAAAFD